MALKNRVEFSSCCSGSPAPARSSSHSTSAASEEIAYALGDSGASLVVVQDDTAAAVATALEQLDGPEIRVLSVDGERLPHFPHPGGDDRASADYAEWRDAPDRSISSGVLTKPISRFEDCIWGPMGDQMQSSIL